MSDQVKFCGISTEQGIIKALRCIAKCADVKCSDCEIDGFCSKDKIGSISTNAADLIEAQAAEIEKLKAQVPRWIPVEERLPEQDVPVLAWFEDGLISRQSPDIVLWNGHGWMHWHLHRNVCGITHWMPLPGAEA